MAAVESTATASQATTQEVQVVPPGHKLFTYFFKTEVLKDEEGKEIGKGKKHPDVKAVLPVPGVDEVITLLAAPDGSREAKVRDLIMDQIADAIFLAGRAQINEFREANPDKEFKASDFDIGKLNLQAIAETPKGQRGAYSPSEEELKAFNELYTEVLVHAVQYDPKKTKTHCDHWKNGMAKVKNNKAVVQKLSEFLTLFAGNVKEEDLAEVEQTYTWLTNRATKYLKAEEKNFLEAL